MESARFEPEDQPPPDGTRRDALPQGGVRGRGAGLNPGNRFESVRLHVLGEHLDEMAGERPLGVQVRTLALADESRTVINRVDSPDLGFEWTVNPYRGCEHGCIYCYARPGHEYLGMSCGLDFETRIVAKHDAPELLRKELASPKWKGETIVLSGVTDPYQPIERELEITRRCLEVCSAHGQAVSLITKNALITRDVDLLASMAQRGLCRAAVSLTTLDNALAASMEPRASSPRSRLATIRALADAGIPVMVMTAPMIPGLNDRELPRLLEAAAEAGARHAGWVLLRLPYQLKDLFLEWLRRAVPEKAARVEGLIRETRGGELSSPEFFARHRGVGAFAEQIGATFGVFARRYGLDRPLPPLRNDLFTPPDIDGQLRLFGPPGAPPTLWT